VKILLVNDYGTPEGGAEIQISRLRSLLREKGHDARLFTSSVVNGGLDHEADYQCLGTASSFRTLLQTVNPWAYLKLREVLREFKPDVVHIKIFLTQLSPLILPALKNIPTIYHVAWYRPVCPIGTKLLPDGNVCTVRPGAPCYRNKCVPLYDWPPLMMQLAIFRRLRRHIDLMIANSESIRSTLEQNGITNVQVLHYGVPISPERPALPETPTVAFAGRLVREKGADVLVRAFARTLKEIPSARLIIAGDGREAKKLKELVGYLGISSHVSMLGHVAASRLDSVLSEAWVQVVPSLWEEPFGIVAIEAMSRGTAVIASDSGGLREIIDDGNTGFLVPPGDVNLLSDKIVEILKSKELAETLGRNAGLAAQSRFGEERFLNELLDIYGSLHI
jgi:glycosyltransferase involved in cell wall biosynthesis